MKISVTLDEEEGFNPILFANEIIDYFVAYNSGRNLYKEAYPDFMMMLMVLNGFAEVYKLTEEIERLKN